MIDATVYFLQRCIDEERQTDEYILDEYHQNYGDFTLWVNKDFIHAINVYNDFSKEYFTSILILSLTLLT